jgi:hypothetical protein
MHSYLIWTLVLGTLPATMWIVYTLNKMKEDLQLEIHKCHLEHTRASLNILDKVDLIDRRLSRLETSVKEIQSLLSKEEKGTGRTS